MACVAKARPCRLNFASLGGLDGLECPLSKSIQHGSATPGGRFRREKRPSPEPYQRFNKREENLSPRSVRPGADLFMKEHQQLPLQLQEGACPKRMRRSRSLSVSFSCCSKNHDGLRHPSRLLDSLVYAYFETLRISRPEDIRTLIQREFGNNIDYLSEAVLNDVHSQLKRLCDRSAKLGSNGSMPVLIQGGGRGSQLQAVHHPHLCRLTQFFERFKNAVTDISIFDR